MIKLNRKDERRAPLYIRQKLLMEAWDNRPLPTNAFEDDPSAEDYDRHGKVKSGSNSNLRQSRWDLGEFPPND